MQIDLSAIDSPDQSQLYTRDLVLRLTNAAGRLRAAMPRLGLTL